MFMQLIKQTKKSLVLNTKHKQTRQRGLDTGQYCSSGLQGTAFMGQLTINCFVVQSLPKFTVYLMSTQEASTSRKLPLQLASKSISANALKPFLELTLHFTMIQEEIDRASLSYGNFLTFERYIKAFKPFMQTLRPSINSCMECWNVHLE